MIKQRHTHHPSPTLPYPNSKTHSYPRLPRDGQATKKNDDMVWIDVMFLKPSSIPPDPDAQPTIRARRQRRCRLPGRVEGTFGILPPHTHIALRSAVAAAVI